MAYESGKLVQNDGNNNLPIPIKTHIYITDITEMRQSEKFSNNSDYRKRSNQSIPQLNSQTEQITSYNSVIGNDRIAPISGALRTEISMLPLTDRILKRSGKDSKYSPLDFRNDHESSNSSIDVTSNSLSEDVESRKNKIVSPLSNDNTSDSITSSGNERDEPITNGHNSLENVDKAKPYRCADCGKGFSQMRNYKYHR